MKAMEINDRAFEVLIEKHKSFVWTLKEAQEKELLRKEFVETHNLDKLKNLTKEAYFPGQGQKKGCLAYDLEWGTRILGSIRGGSKFKYGYEADFPKIKNLIVKLLTIEDGVVYNASGKLSNDLLESITLSKEINGFKTGRTVLPKLLSIYYPKTFLPIFNDQSHFIKTFFGKSFDTSVLGLELYLINNDLLLVLKKELEITLNKIFESFEFIDLLYYAFPKEQEQKGQEEISTIEIGEPQKFEALEVQHYQSLLHMNFKKLFPNFRYFDEDAQNPKKGQYDTQTVGILDMLALDENNNFVVIEIKRQAKDKSLGQILRYMGWIKEEYCKGNQQVKGIIVAEQKDVALDFALKVITDVKFMTLSLIVSVKEQ